MGRRWGWGEGGLGVKVGMGGVLFLFLTCSELPVGTVTYIPLVSIR